MKARIRRAGTLAAVAMLAVSASGNLYAQQQDVSANGEQINVYGSLPTDLSSLPKGPEIEGFISSRRGSQMQVTSAGGTNTAINVSPATEIRAKGGFLGMGNEKLSSDSLLNGLPVTVETVQWEGGLVASQIALKSKDLKTAAMIRNGTDQRFGEHDQLIEANRAAAEALRNRVANIDQYNVLGSTNVYFDTGKWNLSGQAERDLCDAAANADSMGNALLLVVGYTDDVGNEDYNQVLSEKRAGRVVNFLQQRCSWAPWRMLSPTGMAESDPLADNTTETGRAQNRRVSVNILVSKALDGM